MYGPGIYAMHRSRSLLCVLLAGIALVGCTGQGRDVDRPQQTTETVRLDSLAEQATLDTELLLSLAVDLSLSARSAYAAIGRAGNAPSPAAGTREALQARRAGLDAIRDDLLRARAAFVQFVLGMQVRPTECVAAKLNKLETDTEHIVATINQFIESGRLDRIHSLYLDRVDANLVAIIEDLLPDDLKPHTEVGLALAMMSYLGHLHTASGAACDQLQCSLYGIEAPLSGDDRVKLLPVASRVIAAQPAMQHWLQNSGASADTRELLADVLESVWFASRFWGSEMFELIDGADQEARRQHWTPYHPNWPFNALSIAERLLRRYVELLELQRSESQA